MVTVLVGLVLLVFVSSPGTGFRAIVSGGAKGMGSMTESDDFVTSQTKPAGNLAFISSSPGAEFRVTSNSSEVPHSTGDGERCEPPRILHEDSEECTIVLFGYDEEGNLKEILRRVPCD